MVAHAPRLLSHFLEGRDSLALVEPRFPLRPQNPTSARLMSTRPSATLADFSRARDSQITFSVTHGWSAFWRGRPWFAERGIGETSLAVGSSRFWIGWVTRHGDKCARSTCWD